MARRLTILVAEDDPDYALLLKLAFEDAGVNARLHFAYGGKEAIDYLRGLPPFSNRTKHPLPDLLVLDLKMPCVSGFDVLEWLQQHPDLNLIPVVVLSGSDWQEDIERARGSGANFCLPKPGDFADLVGLVARLKDDVSARLALAPVANSPVGTPVWQGHKAKRLTRGQSPAGG